MKHTNKKGFTIVELVIVIAVIAILAAVLIPNLSRLVTKADKSAAMQEAKAAMDNDLINAEGDLANMENYVVSSSDATDLKGKQVYIVNTYSANDTSKSLYVASSTAKTLEKYVPQPNVKAYYEIAAFEGKYTESTKTYEYTTKDGKFVCKLVTGGEWAIDEVAKAGN